MAGAATLLIVDPDQASRVSLHGVLSAAGHDVRAAADLASARPLLDDTVRLVLVDGRLPHLASAIAAIKEGADGGGPGVLVLNGHLAAAPKSDLADGWFDRAVTEPELLSRLGACLRHGDAMAALRASEARVRELPRGPDDPGVAEEALRASEARLRAIVESEPECVKVVSLDGLVLDMNPAGLRLVEADLADQVIGRPVLGLVHPDDREAFEASHRQACRGGNARAQLRIVGLKGAVRWLETHATPLRNADGVIASVLSVTRDVTERKLADERLARATRLYRMLSRANEVMVRSSTEQALYDAVCRVAVDEGEFRMAAVVLTGPYGRVAPAAHAGHEDGYFAAVSVTATDGEHGQGTIGTAIRTGTPDVCNDMSGDPRMAPWRDEALARGFLATASFPLRLRERTIGALVLFADEADCFQSDEVGLLAAVSDDLSFAIESLARERERQQAEARLQRINRLYAVSSEINAAIVRATRTEDLYQQACRIAVEHGGLVMAWVGLARPGEFLRPVATAGHDAGYLAQLRISTAADHPSGCGPAGRAFRSADRRRSTTSADTGAFVSRAEALERATGAAPRSRSRPRARPLACSSSTATSPGCSTPRS